MEQIWYVVSGKGQNWYVQRDANTNNKVGPLSEKDALWYAIVQASEDDFYGQNSQVAIRQTDGTLRIEQTYGEDS